MYYEQAMKRKNSFDIDFKLGDLVATGQWNSAYNPYRLRNMPNSLFVCGVYCVKQTKVLMIFL